MQGGYRKTPCWVFASLPIALIYVLSPIDIIPEALPVIGIVDDAALLTIRNKMTGET